MSLDKEIIDVLMVLAIMAYGIFLGYCAGRAKGYNEGSKMVLEIYRK
jgi:hypothetical protein